MHELVEVVLINRLYEIYSEMKKRPEFKPSCKVWLELKGKRILGKGGVAILQQIDRTHSISNAAEELGMSYRYVWNYLKEIKDAVGEPVVETFKGGKTGGGGARLNALGQHLVNEYNWISKNVETYITDKELLEVRVVKISARNHLKGRVTAVKKNGVMALVKIKVTEPAQITALISNESVEDLNVKVGDEVEAIVKATEVMIAK
jgi:molybdate transport system regulatory protein